MGYINGVNLLPSTGEFSYDTIPLGQRVTESIRTSINRYASGGPLAATGTTTDTRSRSIIFRPNFLAAQQSALVVAWFGNSTDIIDCQIYPSTTYNGRTFQQASGASDVSTVLGLSWRTFRGMPQQGLPNWCEGLPPTTSPTRKA